MNWLYDQIWMRFLTITVGLTIAILGVINPNWAWEFFSFRCLYGGGCRKSSFINNLAIARYMKRNGKKSA